MNKIIFHLDANYFFARCEEIKNPKLEDLAFVVAERAKRSVVSTSNPIARNFGIKSAMKLNNCFKLYKNLIVVKPDHQFYHKKSIELFKCIKDFLDCEIEKTSIDECYIDVTNILDKYHGNYKILATLIRKHVLKTTKIHISIGVGDTKFLAKMAGDQKSPNGINCIFKNEIMQKLWPLPIKNMYLIGKSTYELMKKLNINTIKDFIDFDDKTLLKKLLMSKYDLLIELMTNGGSDFVDTNISIRKSVSSGITFENNSEQKIELLKTINELVDNIYHELEKDKLRPLTISVCLKFKYKESLSKSRTYNNYLIEKKDIYNCVISIFNKIWNNESIRSITISASKLINISNIYTQQKINIDSY